ncbi:MAG: hypothetical protein OEQ39_06795 [Gammaproteobacteria bacterium]|nr:hypothetical protein [Gammaproteobacteria bacterium]
MNKRTHYEVVGEGRPVLVLNGGYLDRRHMDAARELKFEHRQSWERVYTDIPGPEESTVDPSVDSREQVPNIVLGSTDYCLHIQQA